MSESVLNRIAADRRLSVARDKQLIDLERLEQPNGADRRSLAAAVKRPGISLIAEVKTASPSLGVIKNDFSVAQIARTYQSAGARAISVLTEPAHFNGAWDYLRQAKADCDLPILCKDFIVDEFQLRVARAYGADAVLLIAAILDDRELAHLIAASHELGLEVLTEAINRSELDRVVAGKSDLIGINNRNLHDLTIDFEVGLSLLADLKAGPKGGPSRQKSRGRPTVMESGIATRQDVIELEKRGADGILVGTSLMASDNPAAKAAELLGN
jgi:indole-3-glycerol phosphate synthase